jgi:hypothetical protein
MFSKFIVLKKTRQSTEKKNYLFQLQTSYQTAVVLGRRRLKHSCGSLFINGYPLTTRLGTTLCSLATPHPTIMQGC